MSARKKKTKRRRRRITAWVVLLLVIVGVILSTTVFFRITHVEVRGQLGYYSQQQIAQASGIETGMNLFRFSVKEKEQDIWRALPYIETVTIKRSLPGTVIIEVTECKGLMTAQITGGYIVLSDSLKVLEVTGQTPAGMIAVTGLEPVDPIPGTQLTSSEETQENVAFLATLVSSLDQYELIGKVTEIDISDRYNYSLVYDDRFFVMVGTANYHDYKINMLAEVVLHRLSGSDTGYIDISTAGRAVFKRGPLATGQQPQSGQQEEEEIVFVSEDAENMQIDQET